MPNKHSVPAISLILTLALGLRLGAAYYWHSQALGSGTLFRLGDSDGYWHLAKQISQGLPYQYGSPDASIFRAPLLPIVLAPCGLFESEQVGVFAGRVIGCSLGTFAVWLVMLLAARLGDARSATLAGIIAAISPSGIGMSIVILSEMLMVPLLLVYVIAWQNAWRSATTNRLIAWGIIAGVVAGLAVLARPSCLLLFPFITAFGFLFGRGAASAGRDLTSRLSRPRRRHLAIGLLSLIGLSLCMLPWWVRNYEITGRFVPTTLQVGASLLDGLHPGATGASDEGMAFMRDIEDEQRQLDKAAASPPDSTFEYRINQLALRQALDFAAEHPTEAMRLSLVKFARTWSVWPDGGELGSAPLRLAITLSTFGVMLLAIRGSLTLWRCQGWWLGVCWMPCLYFTLLHMVFVGSIRYREPAVFVLTAVAGIGCAEVLARRKLTASKDDAAAVKTPGKTD